MGVPGHVLPGFLVAGSKKMGKITKLKIINNKNVTICTH